MLDDLPPNMRTEFNIVHCPIFSKANISKMQLSSVIDFQREQDAQALAIRQEVLRARRRNRNQQAEEPTMETAEEPAAGNHEEEDAGLIVDEAKCANVGQSSHQAFDEVTQDWSIFDEYEVKANFAYEIILENVHYTINGEDVIKVNEVVKPFNP